MVLAGAGFENNLFVVYSAEIAEDRHGRTDKRIPRRREQIRLGKIEIENREAER